MAEARRAAADDGAPRGALSVGSLESTAALRLPRSLVAFAETYPEVDLVLVPGTTAEMVERVLDHQVEGAFVCGPVSHPDLIEEIMKVSIRQVFGFDSEMEVPAYSEADEHVPDIDPDYRFDKPTTLAVLAGFAHNRRVIVTGYHGTGKSTHVEQVAARLNWPCATICNFLSSGSIG